MCGHSERRIDAEICINFTNISVIGFDYSDEQGIYIQYGINEREARTKYFVESLEQIFNCMRQCNNN